MRLIISVLLLLTAPAIAGAQDFACQVLGGGWNENELKKPVLAVYDVSQNLDPEHFYLLPDGKVVNAIAFNELTKADPKLESQSFHFVFFAHALAAPDGSTVKFLRVEMMSEMLNGPEKARNGMAMGWEGVATSVLETNGDPWTGTGVVKGMAVTCARKELLHLFKPPGH